METDCFSIENFNLRRKKYLERLHECRSDLVDKISNSDERAPYLDIVLDPQNENELFFSLTFLGFLDDNKQISENAKEGKLKKIDLDTSVGVLYTARIVDALNYGKELGYEEGEFYTHFALFARVLYDLTVLLQTIDLASGIAERNGWDMNNRSDADRVRSLSDINEICDALMNTMLNSSYFKNVDRAKSNVNDSINEFIEMAEVFHEEYLNGIVVDLGQVSAVKQTGNVQYVKKATSQEGNI